MKQERQIPAFDFVGVWYVKLQGCPQILSWLAVVHFAACALLEVVDTRSGLQACCIIVNIVCCLLCVVEGASLIACQPSSSHRRVWSLWWSASCSLSSNTVFCLLSFCMKSIDWSLRLLCCCFILILLLCMCLCADSDGLMIDVKFLWYIFICSLSLACTPRYTLDLHHEAQLFWSSPPDHRLAYFGFALTFCSLHLCHDLWHPHYSPVHL